MPVFFPTPIATPAFQPLELFELVSCSVLCALCNLIALFASSEIFLPNTFAPIIAISPVPACELPSASGVPVAITETFSLPMSDELFAVVIDVVALLLLWLEPMLICT
ncbi:hypothetical protein WK55_15750 [Burkholderia ubonensis]|nr:hypothetical protein WK55_15750 [Burkholderia ubonensis]